MPTVYRIQCESCHSGPDTIRGVAGYVTTDGRKGGIILPESYLAVRLDNGEMVCLPHPVEHSRLNGLGFTWSRAVREGRLFRISYKFCQKCGTLNEECRHTTGSAGCLPALVASLLITISLRFLMHVSWPGSLFGGYLALMAVFLAFALAIRFRSRKVDAEAKSRPCTNCQSNDFITIPKAVGQPIICPFCKTRSMYCQIAGIS